MMEIELYSATETAAILGVTIRTLRTYAQQGRIIGQKIGGQWRYTPEAIEEFAKAGNNPPAGADIRDRVGSLLSALDELNDYSYGAIVTAAAEGRTSGFEYAIGARITQLIREHVRPLQKLVP